MGAVLTSLEKLVVLSAWLSAAIVSISPFQPFHSQASHFSEGIPPPSWVVDCRTPEGRQLCAVVTTALLASPGDVGASTQRLIDAAKIIVRLRGDKEDHAFANLIGSVISVSLKRRIRQSDWAGISDIEELIADAESLLELVVPEAVASLRSYAKTTFEAHASNAEPLVEWLYSRTHSGAALSTKTHAIDGEGEEEPSIQDTTERARQIHSQGMEMEGRLRARKVEERIAPPDDSVIWIANLSSLLLAAPLHTLSAYRRMSTLPAVPSDAFPHQCSHGLFAFDSIAAELDIDSDRVPNSGKGDAPRLPTDFADYQEQTRTKSPSRSGAVSPSNGSPASVFRASVSPEKRVELVASEAERLAAPGQSSVWHALVLLFQWGATAASFAVASNAPLLAYSIIVNLGNALLLVNPDAAYLATCQEDLTASSSADALFPPDAVFLGKDPAVINTRESSRGGDGLGGNKQARRGDAKATGRQRGSIVSGGLNSRSGKAQQPLDAKPQISLSVAAGMIAQACVDLLFLILREHLHVADKDELSVTNLEGQPERAPHED